MKLNKILLMSLLGLGLMVSGCASKKHDLSTIEAQKAQQNVAARQNAESTYQMADHTVNGAGASASASSRQSVLDAMARLKAALASNDTAAIKKAEVELKAVLGTLKKEVATEQGSGAVATGGADQRVMKPTAKGVYFDFDSASLKDTSNTILNAYVAWLNSQQDVRVTIEGNCDQRGSREYNLALGQQRADRVKQYLVAHGVASNRLDTVSFGEERPVCRGTGESCWAQNRHADIVAR